MHIGPSTLHRVIHMVLTRDTPVFHSQNTTPPKKRKSPDQCDEPKNKRSRRGTPVERFSGENLRGGEKMFDVSSKKL